MPLYDDERFAFDVEKRFSCDTPKYLLVLVFLCKLRSFVRMGRKKKTAKKKKKLKTYTNAFGKSWTFKYVNFISVYFQKEKKK